ncbi:efflux RND transporter periplasmic adaptor subunit [Parashewanella spongiae]|nr:efflux RND transporter periplasmic adaptor subunit [Parashewanella spongiae]MCL1077070.1 efflux RND transporter periplasmic adaptor subunit [Parashewanella spongiae]
MKGVTTLFLRMIQTVIVTRLKIFLAVFLIIMTSSCSDSSTPVEQSSTTFVESQFVHQQPNYQTTHHYVGQVTSEQHAALSFELAGKLTKIDVNSGDMVQKDQQLATLDTELLEVERQQLLATLKQNNADLLLAQQILNRNNQMIEDNFVSAQGLDEAQSRVNQLQAAHERIKAQLIGIKIRLNKSILIAPFTGQITQKHQSIGNVANAGTPVLTLVNLEKMEVMLHVPSQSAQDFKIGNAINVDINDTVFPTQIIGVNRAVNESTHTRQIRLRLPSNNDLSHGDIAYISQKNTINQSGYWVPVSALTDGVRGLWNVYALFPTKNDTYKVERRDIEILYITGEQAFITGALSDGEQIVSSGIHKLVSNQRVRTAHKAVQHD